MATGAERLKRIAGRLLAAGLFAAAPIAAGQATLTNPSPIRDQDRSDYRTLFSEKLSSVERTRAAGDDMTLAADMMGFASRVPDDDVGVRCLIYIDVLTLASNGADLALMKEAYGLLEGLWPGQDEVGTEKLMQLASRGYRAVERDDREAQGEHYIDLLLSIVKTYEDQNEPEQAIGVGRLASTIARTIGSSRMDSIEARLKRLDAANDMAKRIKMLTLSVQKNPQNSPAARELVKLLITQHNDPQTAAAYVESTNDDELIDLVTRCARGIDQANAASAMRVADWYVVLAEDQQGDRALKMLQLARSWYQRFLMIYPREDALAKRILEMDAMVAQKIEQLVSDNPELIGKLKGGWTPLIGNDFDFDNLVRAETDQKQVKNGQVTLKGGAMVIPFPADKASAYEVRLTVTVHDDATESRPALNMYIPMSKKRVLTTRYFIDHFHIAQIDDVPEERYIKPAPAKAGEKTQLTFQVDESGEETAFMMLYNGKPGVSWRGKARDLDEIDDAFRQRIPEGVGSVMLVRTTAHLTIHAADYRVRK
ncbi:MAG: hypothetical protein AAGC72_14515 [Planctomycetota bacterium]